MVVSNYSKHTQDYRRTQELKEYMKQKTQMSEAAFTGIDWQSHERSIHLQRCPPPHIFIVKFINGWLPLGKLYPDMTLSSTQVNVHRVMSPSKSVNTASHVLIQNAKNGMQPSKQQSEKNGSPVIPTQPPPAPPTVGLEIIGSKVLLFQSIAYPRGSQIYFHSQAKIVGSS
ncbi:hypothetical protein IV203_008935 [Nitzschia inconspicua]|uniref:Uncharacterized protein n=1 Tax=Nitzschia inconspicua TaxID=303405 RepID=A0A9K3PMJ0_9STRA|nr:hypothetical protein IV203_008935 [Nitzschia inconspicua]